MTIRLMQGDLLKQHDVDAIVNTVNCVGVMGKGIALQFKNKWPENYKVYQKACANGEVRPGKMFLFETGGLVKPNFIINFPTKTQWKAKSRLEYIQDGLVDLIAQIRRLAIRSIALPPLGCGNGGLDWHVVRPLIEEAFEALPEVEVRMFEPVATPDAKSMEVKTKKPRMTAGRAAVLKVLDTYRSLNYGLSKIEVQKLAYFLQFAGETLKLNFEPNRYGPYSAELRHVLNNMEGHYIRGVGDGVVDAEIEPMPEALEEAEKFLASDIGNELQARVDRVAALIEGFQSPYGMELLATVHWVATHAPYPRESDEAIRLVHAWHARKKFLMLPSHVTSAWQRLVSEKWIDVEPAKFAVSH